MRVIVNSAVTLVTPGREAVAVRVVEQPTVVSVATHDGDAYRLLGRALSATAPTEGQVLAYLSGKWSPTSALAGNAATATKLATPRTIWGQSFDGSGNISGALSGVTALTMSDNATVGGNAIVTGTLTAKGSAHVLGDAAGDLSYSLTLGSRVAAPAAARATSLFLDTAHGPGFNGAAQVIMRRGGAIAWQTGLSGSASGAKTSVDDYHFYNGTAFVAALTQAGRLTLAGGLASQTDVNVIGGDVEVSRATGSATITPATIRVRSTTNAADWDITSTWGNFDFWSNDGSGSGVGVRARIGARFDDASGATTALVFSTSTSTGVTPRWRMTAGGHWLPETDGVVDLGASDRRVRDGYFSRHITAGGSITASTSVATGTVTASGAIVAGGAAVAANTYIYTNAVGGYARGFMMQTAGVNRWLIYANTAPETGGDAGSNLSFAAYTDAGAFIDTPISIPRAATSAIVTSRAIAVSTSQTPYHLTIAGSSTTIRQVQLGTASNWSTVGTRYSGGDLYMAFNASQTTNLTDAWGQSAPANASVLLRMNSSPGLQFHAALPGAAAGDLASFWGQAVFSVSTAGNMVLGTDTNVALGLNLNSAAGNARSIGFKSANVYRWTMQVNGTESGVNDAGANLSFNAYTDTGSYIDAPLSIGRSLGALMTITRPLMLTQGADSNSNLYVGNGGGAPTNVRTAQIIINSPDGAGFTGISQIIFQRAAVTKWGFGINTATSGAKSSVDDIAISTASQYVAAISTSGRLRLLGGLDFATDGAADIGAVAANRPRDGFFTGTVTAGARVVASAFNHVAAFTPTSSADATGNTRDIRADDNYVYVKTSTGWKRAALSTF